MAPNTRIRVREGSLLFGNVIALKAHEQDTDLSIASCLRKQSTRTFRRCPTLFISDGKKFVIDHIGFRVGHDATHVEAFPVHADCDVPATEQALGTRTVLFLFWMRFETRTTWFRPVLARLWLEKVKEKRMLKTLTFLLSLATLQRAENHPVPPQLKAPLQIFPTEFVLLPLRNLLQKDVLVYLNRDIEILLHCTLQAPVLACSLGYFDSPALFRNPLGNPFRKDIFVLRPWCIDNSLLHSLTRL